MTIDEAIAHAREVSSRKFDDRVHCIRCAEEHEQLAEWLEELKEYKYNEYVICEKYNVSSIDDVYNKAIDDFVEHITLPITTEEHISEIVEQLKMEN